MSGSSEVALPRATEAHDQARHCVLGRLQRDICCIGQPVEWNAQEPRKKSALQGQSARAKCRNTLGKFQSTCLHFVSVMPLQSNMYLIYGFCNILQRIIMGYDNMSYGYYPI